VLNHYSTAVDWQTFQPILLHQEGPQKHFLSYIICWKMKKRGASVIDMKPDLYANIRLIWKGLPVRNTLLQFSLSRCQRQDSNPPFWDYKCSVVPLFYRLWLTNTPIYSAATSRSTRQFLLYIICWKMKKKRSIWNRQKPDLYANISPGCKGLQKTKIYLSFSLSWCQQQDSNPTS
jgi:hypothetical protein